MNNVNRKSGVAEWAEHKVNCCRGCSHACLYCYARTMALQYKRLESGEEWKNERPICILDARTDKAYSKKYNGVVMFPTTHDWTEGTMDACYEVLKRLLAAGNHVLFVSKLGERFVEGVIAAVLAAKPWFGTRLEIRVTCGGLVETTRKFWEPGAPTFEDRLLALEVLKRACVCSKLSASAEPLLEPWNAEALVRALVESGTQEVWVGMMREMSRRLAWKDEYHADRDNNRIISALEAFQASDELIARMVEGLQPLKKYVKWKDSYAGAIRRLSLEL